VTTQLAETRQSATRAVAAQARELTKVYGSGDTAVVARDRVTVDFRRAEFTAIMGPSGSGKSTLMHCLAGLDSPTGGRVYIGDFSGGFYALSLLSGRELWSSSVGPIIGSPTVMAGLVYFSTLEGRTDALDTRTARTPQDAQTRMLGFIRAPGSKNHDESILDITCGEKVGLI
jgi:energy-coupling factor transporter ATP-binding protein EcfA2